MFFFPLRFLEELALLKIMKAKIWKKIKKKFWIFKSLKLKKILSDKNFTSAISLALCNQLDKSYRGSKCVMYIFPHSFEVVICGYISASQYHDGSQFGCLYILRRSQQIFWWLSSEPAMSIANNFGFLGAPYPYPSALPFFYSPDSGEAFLKSLADHTLSLIRGRQVWFKSCIYKYWYWQKIIFLNTQYFDL